MILLESSDSGSSVAFLALNGDLFSGGSCGFDIGGRFDLIGRTAHVDNVELPFFRNAVYGLML